jgi:putative ABC transport system substrate-binding protein
MRRRQFITLVGGAAVAWPVAGWAQQATRNRKVGFLHPGQSAAVSKWIAAIHEGLNGADSQSDARIELVIRLADGDLSPLDRSRIQGVLILSSPLFGGNPQIVADLAIRRTVPTISLFPDIAREGGLLAYGPDIQALYRQAGGMARKVLHGAKVAELPAERPTRFQLMANLKTAKLFGMTLPPSILLRADEVIE